MNSGSHGPSGRQTVSQSAGNYGDGSQRGPEKDVVLYRAHASPKNQYAKTLEYVNQVRRYYVY